MAFLQKNSAFDQPIVTQGDALHVQNHIRRELSKKFNVVSRSLGQHIESVVFLLGAEVDTQQVARHLQGAYGFRLLRLSASETNALTQVNQLVQLAEKEVGHSLFIIEGRIDVALLSTLKNVLGDRFIAPDVPPFVQKNDIPAKAQEFAKRIFSQIKPIG